MRKNNGRQTSGPSREGSSVPGTALAASLFLVALIGYLDYATGSEISVALLYFLPIAIASLMVGRNAGLAAAVLSSLGWYVAEVFTHSPYHSPLAVYWNTLVRLGIFLTVSLLLSRLEAAAAKEKAQREKLEELNQIKNRFVGMAAHDLRSPLTVISIYSHYLLDDGSSPLSPKQMRFLSIIVEKTEHMIGMINDLLDITLIESGRLELRPRVHDYGAFLTDAVSIAGAIAAKRGSAFRLDVEGELPPLSFDRDRIEQVIDNLLMNALKYSPQGSDLSVKAGREGDFVVTKVTDRGPGIPVDEQGKLFVEFSRTSVRPAAGDKSTGLGLAIVKKIVESHGGRIGVDSSVGSGSTFWFSLPVPVKATAPPQG